MKKQILNLGKALNRAEQKQIFGGDITVETSEGSGPGGASGGGVSATCYCNNGHKMINSDCSWCGQVCSIRGGYTGVCLEW